MLAGVMLREAVGKLTLRTKLTILVSVGVFLPLLVLTYMQYRSLAELQEKTKGAFKDGVRQGLTAVQQRMKQRVAEVAIQTLTPIDSIQLSSPEAPEKIRRHFAEVKRSHPEIGEMYVFVYSKDEPQVSGYACMYTDKFRTVAEKDFTPVETSIKSLFDSLQINQNFLDNNRNYLFRPRSCPACPQESSGAELFLPLGDRAKGDLTGFAGVTLNARFVRDELIAKSVIETAGRSHSGDGPLAMAATISDENNVVLYSNAAPQTRYVLESNLDPPFSSWKAKVGLKNTNLDALARDSFLHSAGSTLLVVLVLLAGIVLLLRATDREARLAQAKSNFVSNVSHELKTPLSLISLFSEILELDRVDNEEKKAEYYRIIRHESRRLDKTIDNILDFSKIEAGKKTYRFAEGDMAEVVENVLATYRYQIVNSGFDVQTNIQRDLPSVLVDRDAMAQAISNLLDNAIKYSRDVKQISITTRTVDSKVRVEIADQGIGIPRAEQAKVFEKFYRVGNGLVHDVKGSGLGLSLVKHIIEAHKGEISVDSELGKGSRFTIQLPLARDAQHQS